MGQRRRAHRAGAVRAPLQALAYSESELCAARPRQFMEAQLIETDNCLRGVHFDYGDYTTAN